MNRIILGLQLETHLPSEQKVAAKVYLSTEFLPGMTLGHENIQAAIFDVFCDSRTASSRIVLFNDD